MSLELLDYQIKPTAKLIENFSAGLSSILVAPCRTGKTYALAVALKTLQDNGNLPLQSNKPASILWLTPKNIKIQSDRVLHEVGLKNFHVESYSAIRSSFGEGIWLEWLSKMIRGEVDIIPNWYQDSLPDVIICDECQVLRSQTTQTSKIINRYIDQGGRVILASATPFVKVSEAFSACKALRIVDDHSWASYARNISGNTAPNEINHAAMRRLNDDLSSRGQLVKFEGIKYKHKTMNHCIVIPFPNDESRQLYHKAWEDYLEECLKNNRHTPEGIRAIWVAMLKFFMRAELLKADILAEYALKRLGENKQVIVATNYVESLRAVWGCLKKRGFDVQRVGYVIGGQKDEDRQAFVDRFQEGMLDITLGTLKTGGVGLSMHHCNNNPQVKPRAVILPACWSPINMVQMLGRAHGPTSLSTTHQDIIWFGEGCIEEKVAERFKSGMTSLKEIVSKSEAWLDLLLPENTDHREVMELLERDIIDKDEEGNKIDIDLEVLAD